MARIAVIGEPVRVQGFGLVGALVVSAEEPAAVREAWRSLPDDVEVVILTPAAAHMLAAETGAPGGRLTVVMP
ncbi:V-type ATP synthase subunit F [Planosporangium sp. 12N6]|uniref:V-type ATP synthase subunit F n=1 Tax=Planosporangium spinosum TaxID=3402278 RepID=UPI003CE832FB